MNATRAADQAAVLADPDRVQLLALILGDPSGEASALAIAGGGDIATVRAHLDAMTEAGLLERAGTGASAMYRPTHDALARFGGLLGPETTTRVDPSPDVLRRVTDQLEERFAGTLSAETVRRFVAESYELLASRATVRTHLAVLTARFAAERLDALADVETARRRNRSDVLFVCVHNAGRSQLAAAALRTRAGADVRVRTAGSVPAARIEPAVLEVIDRRGWTPALEFPKPLTDEIVRASDYVITMGCGDACPVVPGRTYLDWSLRDPAGLSVDEVESIADEIDALVQALVEQMVRAGR